MSLNTEKIIEELSQKLDQSDKFARKLEESNHFLETENLELISQLKEKEIQHDTEIKSLLENMDELLESNISEKDGLCFDIEILKKKLKSQNNFVLQLKEEKNQIRNLLEQKISESNQTQKSDIQNILTKENKQLKNEIKKLEEQLQKKNTNTRTSINSVRSIKTNRTVHPRNKPLKRHSVLESMVSLKETQVMSLRTKLEELVNKHNKTRIQLKRQTSIDIKEIKKREQEIATYKKSLDSLETNLESLTEMNKNLNKDLEEKDIILKNKGFGKKILRFFKVVFDVLELFLNSDYLGGLFFVFLFVTALDSLA